MNHRLKSFIKSTPGLRLVARLVERAIGRWASRGFSSSDYWDTRYRTEGSSGAGSSSRLARFKADTLNAFIEQHCIGSVIEFGSGDGSQLQLANYPDYVGVDVSRTILHRARTLYGGDSTKRFYHVDELPAGIEADLTLSLDVVYHLVEDTVFHAHMEQLFSASRRFVVIYASNFDRRDAAHVRHRRFTDWIEANRPEFNLNETIPNPYPYDPRNSDQTSFADFFIYQRGRWGQPNG